jgi:hypothetical protein
MHQQLRGYKVEDKLYVGVREQKRSNTAVILYFIIIPCSRRRLGGSLEPNRWMFGYKIYYRLEKNKRSRNLWQLWVRCHVVHPVDFAVCNVLDKAWLMLVRILCNCVRVVTAGLAYTDEKVVETPCRNIEPNSQIQSRSAISGSGCVKPNDNKESSVEKQLKIACCAETCCD